MDNGISHYFDHRRLSLGQHVATRGTFRMSVNETIMRKIQKCLALSQSSNPHEAATALRQAKALMDKHQLSMQDVELSRIDVVEIGGKYARPPNWKIGLYQAVSKAFACSLFTRGGRPVFVGPTPGPEVAKYALEVLLRQLEHNKKAYLDSIARDIPHLGRAAKVKLGKGYAEGWVSGCRTVVEQFAEKLSPEAQQAHTDRLRRHYQVDKIGEGKEGKSALASNIGLIAGRAGFRDGKQAQIHQGMNTDGGPVLIGRTG